MARVNINRTRSRLYARDYAEEHLVGPLARDILQGARREVPVRTGLLRISLSDTKEQFTLGVTHRVGSRVSYAYLVHGGARAHRIVPRHPGGRLTFYWKKVGRWVALKSVNHPGFKGVSYLQRPLVVYGNAARFRVVLFPQVR